MNDNEGFDSDFAEDIPDCNDSDLLDEPLVDEGQTHGLAEPNTDDEGLTTKDVFLVGAIFGMAYEEAIERQYHRRKKK